MSDTKDSVIDWNAKSKLPQTKPSTNRTPEQERFVESASKPLEAKPEETQIVAIGAPRIMRSTVGKQVNFGLTKDNQFDLKHMCEGSEQVLINGLLRYALDKLKEEKSILQVNSSCGYTKLR